jgi:hypothetical protein
MSGLTAPPDREADFNFMGIPLRTRVEYILGSRLYSANAYYSTEIPDLGIFRGRIAARLDDLGIRLDPQVLWNAIPFSFVVDWFIPFGDWLGSFRQENWDVNILLKDFLHSARVSVFRNIKILPNYGADGINCFPGTVDNSQFTWFCRKRNQPKFEVDRGLVKKPLNLHKVALGAALIGANHEPLSRPFIR